MIADELGFTKAAIYHHFRTREQLLDAVVEPILDQLRAIIAAAEAQRSPHARAEHMLSGYAAAGGRQPRGVGACRRSVAWPRCCAPAASGTS